MLEDCKTASERWGGVSHIIDRWLKERQDLLVLFYKLTTPKALEADEIDGTFRQFCQILVDYVSAGHFEIYDQLLREGEQYQDETGLTIAKQHFAKIDGTTEWILDFNDKYQETDDLTTLSADLSKLGESFAVRFEAEDQMIEILHNAHRNQLA